MNPVRIQSESSQSLASAYGIDLAPFIQTSTVSIYQGVLCPPFFHTKRIRTLSNKELDFVEPVSQPVAHRHRAMLIRTDWFNMCVYCSDVYLATCQQKYLKWSFPMPLSIYLSRWVIHVLIYWLQSNDGWNVYLEQSVSTAVPILSFT